MTDAEEAAALGAEKVGTSASALLGRQEHYANSAFVSAHQRFRVPINVSSMVRKSARRGGAPMAAGLV